MQPGGLHARGIQPAVGRSRAERSCRAMACSAMVRMRAASAKKTPLLSASTASPGSTTAPPPTAEDILTADDRLIPDERLRLIFVCCHPSVAPEARAALTLRLVCGLSVAEIARAFLVAEPAMFQRLTRAKKKIAEAGVSFEVPGPEAWPERMAAVLSTLEVAYARAHEDAAGSGPHAGYAREMLDLTAVLADLTPDEPEALAFARHKQSTGLFVSELSPPCLTSPATS